MLHIQNDYLKAKNKSGERIEIKLVFLSARTDVFLSQTTPKFDHYFLAGPLTRRLGFYLYK